MTVTLTPDQLAQLVGVVVGLVAIVVFILGGLIGFVIGQNPKRLADAFAPEVDGETDATLGRMFRDYLETRRKLDEDDS